MAGLAGRPDRGEHRPDGVRAADPRLRRLAATARARPRTLHQSSAFDRAGPGPAGRSLPRQQPRLVQLDQSRPARDLAAGDRSGRNCAASRPGTPLAPLMASGASAGPPVPPSYRRRRGGTLIPLVLILVGVLLLLQNLGLV